MNQRLLFEDTLPLRHWDWFADFCRYEKLTGGPDPHMKAVVAMCDGLSPEEQAWRAALYAGVYNVPTAEAIWRAWPSGRYAREPHLMEPWLNTYWKLLRLRRERRTVNSPVKLSRYLAGYVRTWSALPRLRETTFEEVWEHAISLPHVGRYAATKLTEIWHQLGLVQAAVQDIRADGGWSPREALRLLYPEIEMNARVDDPRSVRLAEDVAANARMLLHSQGVSLTWFEMEVLLCEYKEAYVGKRQYPGRSLDSELEYHRAIRDYWGIGDDTEHMKIRSSLSPRWALGEVNEWGGVRKDLGRVISENGYVWTDSIFDYGATLRSGNFANPVTKHRVA